MTDMFALEVPSPFEMMQENSKTKEATNQQLHGGNNASLQVSAAGVVNMLFKQKLSSVFLLDVFTNHR